MIEVIGSSRRSFVFPATLPIAYAYYADVERLLSYLPHVCLVRAYGRNQFRLRYSSTELGMYHVCIYADVQTTLEDGWAVRIQPLGQLAPAQTHAEVRSCTAQGTFSSHSVFQAHGDQTRIEYSLQLRANLPTPLALRFVPGTMLNRISRGITQFHIHEISEGFIERSIEAFPCWLAELRNQDVSPGSGYPPILTPPSPTRPEECH